MSLEHVLRAEKLVQNHVGKPSLPEALVERTKKDKLFNDLLRLVEEKELKFSHSQLESGKSYLTSVTSAIWYIDGHQSTLSSRGCEIPELFKPFKGYNCPSLAKHRKCRQTCGTRSLALLCFAACMAGYP